MAASGTVNIITQLLGLGKELNFIDRFTLTNTPTKATHNYREQATADTEEALDLGGVTTVDLIVIKCVANDMTIDTTWVTTYVSELTLVEGEIAVFKPTGTVYIKNGTALEKSTYEYIIIGR